MDDLRTRFQKTGDAWRWEFANLEPTLADDIAIEAIPGSVSYGNESEAISIVM